MNQKDNIRRTLVANVIKDICKNSDYILYRDAWSSQERVIRFTTPFFRKLFSVEEDGSGRWKTGDPVMYEVNNGLNSFTVDCVFSAGSVSDDSRDRINALLSATDKKIRANKDTVILASWDLSRKDGDANKLFESFPGLLEKKIPYFEQHIGEAMNAIESDPNNMTEGEKIRLVHTSYERNPEARAACIAAHGAVCAVCGMDFEKAYGPQFSGVIEVHHIVPLSQIGKEYVVDPVKDLVPVCPNCHTALHRKRNGIYTVEELRDLLSGQPG